MIAAFKSQHFMLLRKAPLESECGEKSIVLTSRFVIQTAGAQVYGCAQCEVCHSTLWEWIQQSRGGPWGGGG